MLMVIEIWLTVKAWRKGWGAWALAPWGVLVGLAFLAGIVTAMGGGPESLRGVDPIVLLPLDLINIAVLSWMAAKGKNQAKASEDGLLPASPAGQDATA